MIQEQVLYIQATLEKTTNEVLSLIVGARAPPADGESMVMNMKSPSRASSRECRWRNSRRVFGIHRESISQADSTGACSLASLSMGDAIRQKVFSPSDLFESQSFVGDYSFRQIMRKAPRKQN